MCGIFGISAREGTAVAAKDVKALVNELFRLSESRGKEAAGVAALTADKLYVYKEAIRATALIRRKEYRDILDRAVTNGSGRGAPATIIGHSRLVTTGVQQNRLNNQPVINAGAVGVHNGIVVNDEELWRKYPEIERHGQVDSEIIVGLIRRFAAQGGSLVEAVRQTFALIKGAASIAVVFDDLDALVLATNNGSLYTVEDAERGLVIFASEEYILRTLLGKRPLAANMSCLPIRHIQAGSGVIVDLKGLSAQGFSLRDGANGACVVPLRTPPRQVVDVEPPRKTVEKLEHGSPARMHGKPEGAPFDDGPDFEAIGRLRRCARCILPETMPFIEFDDRGVCNYCRHYRPQKVRGLEALEETLARRPGGSPRYDCLVGLSGGRDSSYGLHYLKKELGLNPIAFTYDWGMVTDLARRNISRVCGQLGIEHILVSADIEKKRRFIRQNVQAWLRRPALGMIPLFMAGDKQYFYHANKLKKQNDIPHIFLCENLLERTDFKTGFAGVRPQVVGEDHAYTIPASGKLKLIAYYGSQYLRNPSYLNASMVDTVFAYACYYFIPRDYLNLFRFVEWDETRIISTLRNEYDWELATDTESTWRIGDGTASFYNYIYLTVSGICEIDTLRSNQIREGKLTREAALVLARKECNPRYESIRWYLTTIGMGDAYDDVIRRINSIPRLYPRSR